ncbi:unnamed protein product [Rotaria sp. Silwood2]|nr:unnamed protein product [Rotaria sp. Silwood2]
MISTSPIETMETNTDELTLENVIYTGSSEKCCVICREFRSSSTDMITMPKSARRHLLILHRLYAPQGVRCCRLHILNNNRLDPNGFVEIDSREKLKASLQSDELIRLLDDLLLLIKEAMELPRLDFQDPLLSDDDYMAWTGWTKRQFDAMFEVLAPILRSSCNRDTRNALAVFWIKAKTNLSFNQIGTLFNYRGDSETRRKRVWDTFDSVRMILVRDFVPLNLGVGHLTREQALTHNTAFSKEFWDNKVTIIWDGTYLYLGKSSDHYANRSTYSGQKCRHLVKFMSLVLPDGYVLDTIGPFQGTANDASITERILETRNDLVAWCDYGDIMICDRGFRDVIQTMSDLGYEVKSPVYLEKSKNQHTTTDSNESRLITKVRWTVESYHARMKKWRILSDRIENQFLSKLGDIVRIISAGLNAFRGPIISNVDDDQSKMMAKLMKEQKSKNNTLKCDIDRGLISSRSQWKKLDDENIVFPEMDLDHLRELFFGTYQIKQSETYTEEHLDEEGNYVVQVAPEEDELIRCRIQSRHSNATRYYAWIRYSLSENTITAWYCQCRSGARTVGCCGHIASVIWYLSYARLHDFHPSPGRMRVVQAIEYLR